MNIIQSLVRIALLIIGLILALPIALVRMAIINAMQISDEIIKETYPKNNYKNFYDDTNKKN
jgi:hypothetical protein